MEEEEEEKIRDGESWFAEGGWMDGWNDECI